MDKSEIGNRMKMYEDSTESRVLARLPIIVRLDGRGFSKFTRGMKKPFDDNFREAMIEVSKYLVTETNAKIAYTQSDEITLVIYNENVNFGTNMFDGRVQKMASTFASLASVKFLIEMQSRFPERVSDVSKLPTFDARVFAVPSKTEASNNLVWRCLDASKNSISMVAQSEFSQKELVNLSGNQMKCKLLTEKSINWNNFTSDQKQGSFIRKEKVEMKLTPERMIQIPEDKRPKDGLVMRSKMVQIDMPNFLQVKNRTEFIFDCAKPITE
jgi:tRNA(His) guanylyltransferase